MRRVAVALASAALVAGSGCLSGLEREPPERQRFALQARRSGEPVAACDCSARLEPVQVARLFEGKQFVYRTGESSWEEDFFNRFFLPPGASVQEELQRWLADAGLFARWPAPPRPDFRLRARVTELYADARSAGAPVAILGLEVELIDGASRTDEVVFSSRLGATVPAARPAGAAVVAAWNEALARSLADLEEQLRGFLESRPAEDAARPPSAGSCARTRSS